MPFVMWMYFHLYLNSHLRHSWKLTRRSLWTFGLGRSVWHPMSSVSQSPGLSIIVTIAIVTVIIILSSNPSPSRTSPFWHASCLDKRMLQKAPKCPFWANIARSLFRSPLPTSRKERVHQSHKFRSCAIFGGGAWPVPRKCSRNTPVRLFLPQALTPIISGQYV